MPRMAMMRLWLDVPNELHITELFSWMINGKCPLFVGFKKRKLSEVALCKP